MGNTVLFESYSQPKTCTKKPPTCHTHMRSTQLRTTTKSNQDHMANIRSTTSEESAHTPVNRKLPRGLQDRKSRSAVPERQGTLKQSSTTTFTVTKPRKQAAEETHTRCLHSPRREPLAAPLPVNLRWLLLISREIHPGSPLAMHKKNEANNPNICRIAKYQCLDPQEQLTLKLDDFHEDTKTGPEVTLNKLFIHEKQLQVGHPPTPFPPSAQPPKIPPSGLPVECAH